MTIIRPPSPSRPTRWAAVRVHIIRGAAAELGMGISPEPASMGAEGLGWGSAELLTDSLLRQ